MILFYSQYCEYCTRLIDAIKRHDTNKIVKLVSIDTMRKMNLKIDKNIHSVPTMYFEDTKEYIYGKQVFDYLLLPNRGKLLTTQSKEVKTISENIKDKFEGEPLGFTLNNIISQNFENINETESDEKTDINFAWSPLNENVIRENTEILKTVTTSEENGKTMPSIESILQQRERDLNV